MTAFANQGELLRARQLIQAGRLREAQQTLTPLAVGATGLAQACYLLGVIARLEGRVAEAEARFGAALGMQPVFDEAALELARLFNASGRHAQAVTCTRANAAVPRPSQALLAERARAWQALDRADKRLEARERIADLYPHTPAILHNLAAALGDAGHTARAEVAARQTLAAGGDAPETWLVLARALQSQNHLDEADAAFGEALKRRPAYADALRDRAQLLWMRSGEIGSVLAMLDRWGQAFDPLALHKLKVRFLAASGDTRQAYGLLLRGGAVADAELEVMAARLALPTDPERALAHARRAEALSPDAAEVRRAVIDALIAVGESGEAGRRIDRELQATPGDAALIAARWTTWRIEGDPRAAALYDYAAKVLAQTIDTPPGWQSLSAYLGDLAVELERLHRFQAHPLDQSVRGGGQTSANLLLSQEPAIKAFTQAVDGPIRRYLALTGGAEHPVWPTAQEDYRIAGMWSVRLRPGGFHQTHVHPRGTISSACYIVVPEASRSEGPVRAGWLKLGQPPAPALAPEHFVQPEPGRLVLFPSYMWHGTEPFDGGGVRLTIAFDIVPEAPELAD